MHRLRTAALALGALVALSIGSAFAGVGDPAAEAPPERPATPAASPSSTPPGDSAVPTDHKSRPTSARRSTPRTYVVTRVVDGDPLDLGDGRTVRLVGIDAPERGECGYERATASLARLVRAGDSGLRGQRRRVGRVAEGCAAGYAPCLPLVSDLDCGEIGHPVRISGTDPYRLDSDGDGVGCDS